MENLDCLNLDVQQLLQAFGIGKLSSLEVTQACCKRAVATAELGAYLLLDSEQALQQAQACDEGRGQRGGGLGLHGVPVALKDNICTQDLPTTCGSKILRDFRPPYDATVVTKLKQAGAVVLGKANMDEFAMGSSSEHSAYGPVKNPWDTSRVAGGSSGGSAVAVAAGSAYAALGTDTGGSVRQPAAFNGVVGLKPTYGRVSRYGVVAYASSLDQVGPITKGVADSALLLQIIAGHDPKDATSAVQSVPNYSDELELGVKGLRLGVPQEYFVEGVDAEVKKSVQAALAIYEKLGATLVEISLPHTPYCIACYYLIATAEASSNLARYDGVRYGLRRDPGKGLAEMYEATRGAGFGFEVKRRIILGTYALSAGYYDAYYLKAQKVRTLIREDFERAFLSVDALVTPTAPGVAFALGEKIVDPMKMYLADIFTVSANLAGIPAISLPCGWSHVGLPMGLQILGPWWQEGLILRIARAFERECAMQGRPLLRRAS